MESIPCRASGQWHENCALCFGYLTTPLESVAAIQHAFIFCNVRLFSSDLQKSLMSFVGQPVEHSSKYDFTPTLNLNLPAEIGGMVSDLEAFRRLIQLLDDVASFPCDEYEEYMKCLLKLADSVGDKDLADDICHMFTYDQSERDPLKKLWSRTWFNIQHPEAVQHDPQHSGAIDKLKRCLCSNEKSFDCHRQPFENDTDLDMTR